MWWECEIFLQKFWNAKIMTWNQPCKNLWRRESCEEIGFIFCKHLLECTDHSYWKAALHEFVNKRTIWVSYFVRKNCKTDHDCQCDLLRICEEENNVKKWVSCFVHKNWKCTDHDQKATFQGFVKKRTMWRNGFHILFIKTAKQVMTENSTFLEFVKKRTWRKWVSCFVHKNWKYTDDWKICAD